MVDLLLMESRQVAMRRLLAAEPVPGTAPVVIAPRARVPEAGRLNRMAAVARMNGCDRDTADQQERLETFAGTRMVSQGSSF